MTWNAIDPANRTFRNYLKTFEYCLLLNSTERVQRNGLCCLFLKFKLISLCQRMPYFLTGCERLLPYKWKLIVAELTTPRQYMSGCSGRGQSFFFEDMYAWQADLSSRWGWGYVLLDILMTNNFAIVFSFTFNYCYVYFESTSVLTNTECTNFSMLTHSCPWRYIDRAMYMFPMIWLAS